MFSRKKRFLLQVGALPPLTPVYEAVSIRRSPVPARQAYWRGPTEHANLRPRIVTGGTFLFYPKIATSPPLDPPTETENTPTVKSTE